MCAVFPDMQLMRHAFRMQNAAQIFVVSAKRIGFADSEYDVHTSQMSEPLGTREIRQEMSRRVEIDVLVVVTLEKIGKTLEIQGQVVASGEGGELSKQVRMAHSDVHCMISAKTAPVHDDTRMGVLKVHEGKDLVEDVLFVLLVTLDTPEGARPPAVEAFGIDSIHAEELEKTILEFVAQHLGHAQVLVLVKAPSTRGENDHLRPCVSKNEELHVSIEPPTPPAVVLPVHLPNR